MKASTLLLPAALLLTANIATANETEQSPQKNRDLIYGIQLSVGFGGDTFITDGTTTVGTETHAAGESNRYGVYVIKPKFIADFSGKFALNSISGDTDYTNGSEEFSTVSFDFLLMKELSPNSYIGAGFTSHLAPSYEIELTDSGVTYTDAMDYDPALGFIFEYTKVFRSGIEVGLSYTNIEYSGGSSDSSTFSLSETVNASSFALTAGISF